MYRAAGNRIAIDFKALKLPMSDAEALDLLIAKDIHPIDVSLIELARTHTGKPYQCGVHPNEAPRVFDCSSFTQWLYANKGIWLPRYAIDQRDTGRKVAKGRAGDLIFTSGKHYRCHWGNAAEAVGHTGILTGEGTVISASVKHTGVEEELLSDYLDGVAHRGIRRYIPSVGALYTLVIPEGLYIDNSHTLRWKILHWLKTKHPRC